MAQAVLERYGEDYLDYEIARQFDYRAIALKSLAEAGLSPGLAHGRPLTGGAGRSILDVGCATGALLAAFAEAGWEATGVEVSEPMADYGRTRYGLDLRTGTLEDSRLETGAFDAVVATHVIEHLCDPRAFLAETRRLLAPAGRLYLITPNAGGFQAAVMREDWRSAIRDHLFLFSARTLSALLRAEGFSVDYLGTWGGWPAGMRPTWLKRPLDAAAKALGLGDVMVVAASPAASPAASVASEGGNHG